MSLIEGPERRIFVQKQSIFRSLLSVWSVRDVVFAVGLNIGGGIWQPAIARAPNMHAHQHAIKRHLYSQRGIGCQLLHVCRLQVACVPRIGAGVNYLPLLPSPCSPSLPGLGHMDRETPSILESSNEAATTACDALFRFLLTDDDGEAPEAMPSLPIWVTRASQQQAWRSMWW